MGKFIDMAGWKMWEHGVPDSRLTVIERAEDYITPTGKHYIQWLCECSCVEKNQIVVQSKHLRYGHTKSCGCLSEEHMKELGLNSRKHNPCDLSGEYGIGYTSKGEEFYFDKEDVAIVDRYTWCIDSIGRVCSSDNGHTVYLSRLVMNAPDGMDVDHIFHNRRDNRKSKLRVCLHIDNCKNNPVRSNNTSGYTGVWYSKNRNKWAAEIKVNKKKKHLGYFNNKEDAYIAYEDAKNKYFGEFGYKIDEGDDAINVC